MLFCCDEFSSSDDDSTLDEESEWGDMSDEDFDGYEARRAAALSRAKPLTTREAELKYAYESEKVRAEREAFDAKNRLRVARGEEPLKTRGGVGGAFEEFGQNVRYAFAGHQ